MSLYRDILGQSWHLVWRGKYLWFFGLFAALLGNGGELEIIFRYFNVGAGAELFAGWREVTTTGLFSLETLNNIGRLLVDDPLSLLFILAVLLFVLFVAVFLVWLIVVSQAAIVNNAARHFFNKKHDFRSGLEVGMKKFWPVLGLNAIGKVIIYCLFVLISLPAIISLSQNNFLPSSLLFIISFLVFVPIAITLSFIVKYAIAYVVVKENRLVEALRAGWQLFAANWLISVEMAFILFFINFAVGLALIMLFLVLAMPFLFVTLVLIKSGLFINLWIIIILAALLYLAIIALIGSALAAFQVSAWTGLFIKLLSRGGISKLVRVFDKGK